VKSIVIFGAQGQAKVAVEAIEQIGTHRIAGFVAEGPLGFASPYPVLGVDTDVARLWREIGPFDAHVAIGDATIRQRIVERLLREIPNVAFPPVIHPFARMAKNATVSAGAFIAIGAAVCADARIGAHVIVNTNASVDHDCVLADFSFVGPGAALGGTVIVGRGAFIGIGATVLPNLRIGDHATIGGGAVVIRDVPVNVTGVGVPAS
jgi:sugar O-acyltransferase (sialic acid O-acetyltransferase NeuD family)